MDARLRRNMMIITAVHVVLILVLAVQGALADWMKRRKKPEQVTIVDIRTMALPQPQADEPPPILRPDTPPPEPPKPEPVSPPPEPTPVPVKKTPKKTVEVSKKLVRRNQDTPPPKRQVEPNRSPEDIRKALQQGMSDPMRTATLPSSYFEMVHAALNRAWAQPGGDTVPIGTVTQVAIVIERDGRISSHRLTRPSGNPRMDASVMAALSSVPRVPPLPSSYAGSSREITVDFQLTGTTF